mmetsp:Transcript_62678/g.103389  ORF Transcript_62678/g.103389 Transcript_62678/m.103389 type:complete len:96 (-) Transcript_62678:597-884(-)
MSWWPGRILVALPKTTQLRHYINGGDRPQPHMPTRPYTPTRMPSHTETLPPGFSRAQGSVFIGQSNCTMLPPLPPEFGLPLLLLPTTSSPPCGFA